MEKDKRKRARSPSPDIIRKRREVVDDPAGCVTPSALSQDFRSLDGARFALNRPPTLGTIPLVLIHPAFGRFVENLQLYEPTEEDDALVGALRQAMPRQWSAEAEQCEEFRRILTKYYDLQLYAADVAGTARKSEAHLLASGFMAAVLEGKLCNGKGDPEVQGCLYWLESIRRTVRDGLLDPLPCMTVSLVGPTIGFSGVVLTDRVMQQPFGSFQLHTNLQDHEATAQLSRAFGAFRIACGELRGHYANPLPPEERQGLTFPYPNSLTTEGVKLTYFSRLDTEKLVFLATTTDGTVVLVKFTQRYSVDAHRFCASSGIAPELIGYRSLPGRWYMVVMEYLDAETYRVLEPQDGHVTNIVEGIQTVVKRLHEGGYVHGDLRRVNMMTRSHWSSSGDASNVFLIDFDWAGPEGSARYPPGLNRAVKRHHEAKAWALIKKTHDWFMVDHMFR